MLPSYDQRFRVFGNGSWESFVRQTAPVLVQISFTYATARGCALTRICVSRWKHDFRLCWCASISAAAHVLDSLSIKYSPFKVTRDFSSRWKFSPFFYFLKLVFQRSTGFKSYKSFLNVSASSWIYAHVYVNLLKNGNGLADVHARRTV